MTLLQAWIYEHFPMFSPPPNMNYVNTLPRVMRWANGMSTYLDPLGALKHFRLMMDKMTRHDVIWNPYGNVRDVCPLEDITFYNGGICFFDIDEVYFGERVLRQFGIQQCIPSAPSPSLSSKNKTGKISTGIVTQYWECRDHYIIPVQNRVPLSQTPWDCVDTYLEWYNVISHPYLVNFNPRDPPPYITLYRPPPCDWNAIVNEIGRLLEVGMSSGGGEIPSEKREYFQRALALMQSKY
ncbi:hypothetical protein IFM89_031086 [Coptis chinensis]|uniref:Aminotransferase-like plant mobile domain-containing protein n=1 Tax=Coptis chinensis TaxID=261450 RepID=A0A835M781_9MAGN|nr:hypothetical protein IFM89_031086 [Coptis chinensis]